MVHGDVPLLPTQLSVRRVLRVTVKGNIISCLSCVRLMKLNISPRSIAARKSIKSVRSRFFQLQQIVRNNNITIHIESNALLHPV